MSWLGWSISIGLHALALAGLLWGFAPERPRERKRTPVKVSLVARKPAPAPTAAQSIEPAPAPAPAPATTRRPAIKKREPQRRAVRRSEAPRLQPQQARQQQQPATPRLPRFAVSLEATVPGGGVALPAAPGGSGSAFAAPEQYGETRRGGRGAAAPAPSSATRPVESSDPGLTTLPRLLSTPSASTLRAAYPDDAREQGLEGNVRLKILVSASGQVTAVRVLRRAGNGFDEAAKRLVRSFRFSAGRRGSKPVAVWIPWTYKFRLNG